MILRFGCLLRIAFDSSRSVTWVLIGMAEFAETHMQSLSYGKLKGLG